MAAAMSSIDSVLLVAASSVDHDLIDPHREGQTAMRLTRVWILLLSLVAAGLSLVPGQGIVEMSAFSGSMYAACFLPTLVVGLFWRRATAAGATTAIIVGFVVTPCWRFSKHAAFDGTFEKWHEVYVGIAASMLVYLAVSLMTVPETPGPQTAND